MLKEYNKMNLEDIIGEDSKKQMKLNNFCIEYDIPKSSIMEWIHGFNFPAYKIGGRWYVDINEFYKWRKFHHKEHYKYA